MKSLPKKIPQNPGVYQFLDGKGYPIYIGKAKNLRSRLSSYFALKLLPKTSAMVSSAASLSYTLVDNETEALLLEARLVRKYMPKYNSELKDDKSPLYIVVTKDRYERVLALRKSDLKRFAYKKVFGPFTSSRDVKYLLGKIRKLFPFSTHLPEKRVCIYSQIGLCNPCPSTIKGKSTEYSKNVSGVIKILSHGFKPIKKELLKAIKLFAKAQNYEKALEHKKKLDLIDSLTNNGTFSEEYITNPNFLSDIRAAELQDSKRVLSKYMAIRKLSRIECFDVAHLAGNFPTASMVVAINGEMSKSEYKYFKISTNKKGDTDRLEEALIRRLKHLNDWGRPDLIIVDGGKPQVGCATKLLKSLIPVVGIAKREETLVLLQNGKFVEHKLSGKSLKLVQRLRDEAHRFSRVLHHKQVSAILKRR